MFPPSPFANSLFVALPGACALPCARTTDSPFFRTGRNTQHHGDDWFASELERRLGLALQELFSHEIDNRDGKTVRRVSISVPPIDTYFLPTLFNDRALGLLDDARGTQGRGSMWSDTFVYKTYYADRYCLVLSPYRDTTLVILNYPARSTFERGGVLSETDLSLSTIADVIEQIATVLSDARGVRPTSETSSAPHPYWGVLTSREEVKAASGLQGMLSAYGDMLRKSPGPRLNYPVLPFEWVLDAVAAGQQDGG